MIVVSSVIEDISAKKFNWICLKLQTLNWNVHID